MYTLETFDGNKFDLTSEQWDRLKSILLDTDQKLIKIGEVMLNKASIKDVVPNYERRDEVEKDKIEAAHPDALPEGEIAKYLLTGQVEKITPDKTLRLKYKRMYYEHVKRRPMVNELELPRRTAAWQQQQSRLPRDQQRERPMLGFDPGYDEQEKYIIATPLEVLMEEYGKSIS